jgi:CRISPR-associated protein Cmr1
VRGHLRFWWRACHAHRFADAKELFRRESEIWGQAAGSGSQVGPSPIQVEITYPDKGQGQADFPGNSEPRYALFPFQGEADADDEDAGSADGLRGVRFRLRLTAASGLDAARAAELRRAAETAVAAWVLFGGIGARTRRGCGSLWCAEPFLPPEHVSFRPRTTAPQATEAERWIHVGHVWLPNLVVGAAAAATSLKIPVLQQSRALTGPRDDTVAAWRAAVRLMEQFSQGSNVGRDPNYGRSRWPEADSARAEWPALDPRHAPLHPARKSYPRADLRLPIVLQRLGEKPYPEIRGSKDSGATRMASPVILKALPVSETEAAPLMLMLNAPHVWDTAAPGVKIASRFGTTCLTQSQLELAHNALHPDQPRLMAPGRTIRDAFVAWAEQCWDRQAATL